MLIKQSDSISQRMSTYYHMGQPVGTSQHMLQAKGMWKGAIKDPNLKKTFPCRSGKKCGKVTRTENGGRTWDRYTPQNGYCPACVRQRRI